jgi:hypothetical protein
METETNRNRNDRPASLAALRAAALLAAVLSSPAPCVAATYYVSPSGSDAGPGTIGAPWRTIGKAATTLAPGDTVLIRAGTYNEQVRVAVSGTTGAEVTFAAYPGESPVLDGTGIAGSSVDLAGLFEIVLQSWVRVRGLRVQHVGQGDLTAGILVESSQHVTIESCSTYDTISSGIGVWGSADVTLDGNDIARACVGPMQESISVGGTTGFEVRRNVVRDGPAAPAGKEGICIKDGSNTGRVHHNQITGLHQKLGLYLDAWDKHTFDIDVYDNLTWGIEGADGIALASEMGGLLEDIRVFDNVSRGNGYFGIAVGTNGTSPTHPMSGILIVNNTVVGNGTTGWGGGITVYNADASNVIVRNNLVNDNASFQIAVSADVPAGAVTVDHNLVYPFLGIEPDEVRGTSYVEADPLFVNAATHDYHLQPGSPAIDRGNMSLAPTADADGLLRPQGASVDIGAYEIPAPLRLHTLAPCRVVDTRWLPEGPVGGPAIQPSGSPDRAFVLTGGPCSVPADARAVSANLTVTQPQAAGTLLVYPAGLDLPATSTVSFAAGRTRANNAILGLSAAGDVRVHNSSAGTVHFIVDVNGYFR